METPAGPIAISMHEPTATNPPHPPGAASKPPQPPLYIPAGHVAFRLLCHASRVGGLIGKSGSVIKQLQQNTNSRIRVEDPIGSSDHRVISVVASPAVVARVKIPAAAAAGENSRNGGSGDGDDEEWFEVSAAQEGVVRVVERVVEVAAEGDAAAAIGGMVSCRLLAWKNQASAVIGKGGKVVEKIRKETGCRVRVLSSEKYFSNWSPEEEIVEVEGTFIAVKKAIIAVTGRMQEFPPPIEKSKTYGTRSLVTLVTESLPILYPDIPPRQSHLLRLMPSTSVNHASGSSVSSLECEIVSNVSSRKPQHEVVFKILCSNEKVGGIMGKGGSIVRALENETGASINVGPALPDCDERLITITAMESLESQYSSAQHAAVLVFYRATVAGLVKGLDSSDLRGIQVSARVIVSSNHVGCLLGKGGTIISEMRKVTGTGLRIVGGNQVPKCASENDQVVQITGAFSNVQDALNKVTGRLRENALFMKMPSGSGSRISWRIDNNAYSREKDVPPFEFPGPSLSLGASENVIDHSSLTKSMNHLGISTDIEQHQPYPQNFVSPLRVPGIIKENSVDAHKKLPLVKGDVELSSGSRSADMATTTLEVVVSDDAISSIYGENGNNIALLREISRAEVTVSEPRPGTTQRSVVISGTPDQTQVAQSLLQAFILPGS
ncbi:KH domain-containing protein HEN4-like isoform X2 [Andrographis paniculata]|uniref:KH domain-containing protein HEN4-like isoform X2 n=1 Tax=Andrographis paniculata TaxID=175694 RepID=UPI0021E92A02|nr:KH domain-containing protein HEN4-like isoform X2 [Andrographis paniculata]